ncbi:MAG TPA: hypothetical protein VFN64_04840 [Burkholderiaceae bacterium]|nr:hypothetical protein [Burkholderiaceae bacterium]
MRKAGIFYFSLKDGEGRQPVSLGPVTFPPAVGYVRCEVVEARDLDAALDLAKPRRDEHVMNTHWLE